MATSSAMKSSLVLLLLLSAVVASHAHQVSCKNTCKDPIWLNGNRVSPGQSIVIVNLAIFVEVFSTDGGKHSGTYKCPQNVQALEFQFDEVTSSLNLQIVRVVFSLGEIVGSLLGLVVHLFPCKLHY